MSIMYDVTFPLLYIYFFGAENICFKRVLFLFSRKYSEVTKISDGQIITMNVVITRPDFITTCEKIKKNIDTVIIISPFPSQAIILFQNIFINIQSNPQFLNDVTQYPFSKYLSLWQKLIIFLGNK